MKIEFNGNHLFDYSNTMYPCDMWRIDTINNSFETIIDIRNTVYGYVLKGAVIIGDNVFHQGFFCLPIRHESKLVTWDNTLAMIVIRYGYQGQELRGAPVKGHGRLTYIDGCSDSLLVYPPRCGDPSLNHLHFPSHIEQTYHVHPSIRLGMIINGRGCADYGRNNRIELTEGSVFALDAQEKHRFITGEQQMDIIAFHPDGDWGPKDHDHTMLNRTYR